MWQIEAPFGDIYGACGVTYVIHKKVVKEQDEREVYYRRLIRR